MSVINGTPGADALNGTALGDQINGGDGDDVIRGFGGADTVNGGAGADRFVWNAGEGSDRVEGGADADTAFLVGDSFVVSASAGHALVKNLGETVDLHGVEGLNIHGATAGASFVVGDLSATDVRQVVVGLDAGANAVALNGAATGDVFEVQTLSGGTLRVFDTVGGVVQTTVVSKLDSADQVTVDAGAGNDVIVLETPVGVVAPAPISAHGGAGNDTVTGSTGGDLLFGDIGNDEIDGGGGADTIDGGAGQDTLVVTGGADAVTLTAAGGHLLETIGGATANVANVETISLRPTGQTHTISLGDLSSAGVTTVNLDLSGSAPGQADKVFLSPQAADVDLSFTSAADGSSVQALYTRQGAVIQTVNVTGLGAADAVAQAGGAGDDVFSTTAFSSHVKIAVDGAAGDNREVFFGTLANDVIDLTANGTHAELTLNGSAALVMDNVQTVSIVPVQGFDTVTVGDLTGTDVRHLEILLATPFTGQPDGGPDLVNLNFTTVGALGLKLQSFAGPSAQENFTITDSAAPTNVRDGFVGGLGSEDDVFLNFSSNGEDSIRGLGGSASLRFGAVDDHIGWSLLANQVETDRIDGGAGADSFSAFFDNFKNSGDPGSHDDTGLSFSLVSLESHSLLHMFRAEPEEDSEGFLINTTFDLSNVETVVMRGGGASDTFFAFDQSGTAVQHIDIDAGGGSPDGERDIVLYDTTSGADNIVVRIAQVDLVVENGARGMVVHNLDASDATIIRTGDGDDRIDMTNFYQGLQGQVIIDAGAGNDTIIAGAGPAVFDFGAGGGGGVDMVFGFAGEARGGHDAIQILGGSDHSFADLVNHGHLVGIGGDVFLSDGLGGLMVLKGVTFFDLSAADFSF